jgi:aerotaxis receptor
VNLHSIIGDVRANFDQISMATDEIADGNMDLSGRTESQASSLQQTAASMEQLTSTVQQSASMWPAPTSWPSARASGGAGRHIVRRWWLPWMRSARRPARSSTSSADRRHRFPDQYPGTECGGGSGACRGSRARLCRGGQRSACTGAALGTAAKEIKELIDASMEKVQAGTQLTNSAGTTMNQVIESVAA